MLGQGSPVGPFGPVAVKLKPFVSPLAGCYLPLRLWVVVVTILVLTATQQLSFAQTSNSGDDRSQIEIRCQWGGGGQRTFVGSLELLGGELLNRRVLTMGIDAPVSTQQRGNTVRINHLTATDFGGVDLLIAPESDSSEVKIRIKLASLESPNSKAEFTVALSQLTQEPAIEVLDDSGNRISVSRSKSDQIQVDVGRPHLVFDAGEQWQFRCRPSVPSLESNELQGTVEISKQGSPLSLQRKSVKFERQPNRSWDWAAIDFQVPEAEGIYHVEICVDSLRHQAKKSLPSDKILRRVEFVVLAKAAATQNDQEWQLVLDIDLVRDFDHDLPGQSLLNKEKRLLPPIPMLAFGPSLESLAKRLEKKQTMGNDRRRYLKYDDETLLQLQVAGWQTIPLQFAEVSLPYAIEIDYLSTGPLSFGCSLLEQDGDGQVTADGFDFGVFLPETIVSSPSASQIKTHRFMVWPNSKKSHLLMVNRHQTHPVAIKAVRVLKSHGRLPMKTEVAKAPSEQLPMSNRLAEGPADVQESLLPLSNESNAATEPLQADASIVGKDSGSQRRQLYAMIENIDFKREYNSPAGVDPLTGQPLDDWTCFYLATDRMIQQLKAGGFDGAYLTVMTDGTSLFPSSLLAPSPKCDTGVFFSDGRDPVRKDVLELVLRMFEREGLKLIPMLAFNSPLPELEELRSASGDVGLDLVSKSGARHRFGSDPSLPMYNPLDVRVQHSISEVVAEIGQRYRGHSALAGVALACRPDTATLLPGSRWGYDSMTLNNFVHQNSQLEVDRPVSVSSVARFESEWLIWRCEKMANWYDRMGQVLTTQSNSARLYVAPIDLYRNAELASRIAPNLHRTIDFEKLLIQMGLADRSVTPQSGKRATKVVRLIPHRLAFDRSTIQQRSNAAVKNAKQIDSVFRNSGFAGDLFHHRGQWAHFLQLQQLKPFARQKTPLVRMQRLGPGQKFSRQRFVEAIVKQDSRMIVDGGWRSLANDPGCDDLLEVFRQLPAQSFIGVANKTLAGIDSLPVVVRQLSWNGKTIFYIANASPWNAKVTLNVPAKNASGEQAIQSLSKAKFALSKTNSDRVDVELPPFGLVGGVSSEGAIMSYSFDWSQEVAVDLRKRIFALQLKLQQALRVPAVDTLVNPDFNLLADTDQAIGGWEIGDQPKSAFQLQQAGQVGNDPQPETPPNADSFLRVSGVGDGISWIRSHPLKPTSTGRLSISVLLRIPADAKRPTDAKRQVEEKPPVIRVAVDGRAANSDYYRFGVVGQELKRLPASQLVDSDWKRFAVHFDDLPDQLSDLRIGFDVIGAGVVDIAKVRLYDRWFDEKDARAITQLLASADAMSLQPARFDRCRRLLEEYWAVFLNEYFSLQSVPRGADGRVPMFQNKSRLLHR